MATHATTALSVTGVYGVAVGLGRELADDDLPLELRCVGFGADDGDDEGAELVPLVGDAVADVAGDPVLPLDVLLPPLEPSHAARARHAHVARPIAVPLFTVFPISSIGTLATQG